MSLTDGRYTIRPKTASFDSVLIGPVPITAPDVPLRCNRHPLTENWLLRRVPNSYPSKYKIYSARGKSWDYKWIVKAESSGVDRLYVSSKTEQAAEFSITQEGNFWIITHGPNGLAATITYKNEIVFRPQDGSYSELQRFLFEPQPEH